uniref:Uncharacterized protein n=1 Tax=Arundo donax TaxID=35708 RepID=A0A0A8YZV2_ARUDO
MPVHRSIASVFLAWHLVVLKKDSKYVLLLARVIFG